MQVPETISEDENLAALDAELDWLEAVIAQVLTSYSKQESHEKEWCDIAMPTPDTASVYGCLIAAWKLDRFERLALALAIAPHLRPQCLDAFFAINSALNRSFTEFGGRSGTHLSGFVPSGQTLMFVVAANQPSWRGAVLRILSPHHRYAQEGLFREPEGSDSPLTTALLLSEQWLAYFISGEKVRPEAKAGFPAQPMTTTLEWPDLVLDQSVMAQVSEIHAWLTHGTALMTDWGLAKRVKPGFRTIFSGRPGTGKRLTATLLGKATGREVYRLDLSALYPPHGETEKNISRVFDVASRKGWILFFDEADALFGKRTAIAEAHDPYANQETHYLLQRIEDFPGTVILTTNRQSALDIAFTQRFQSEVHFNMPAAPERLRLWKSAFDGVCPFEPDVDLEQIARDYELTGGTIANVLRHCALAAIHRGSRRVTRDDILSGIRRGLLGKVEV